MSTEQIETNLTEAKGRARKIRARLTEGDGDQRDRRVQLAVKMRTMLTQTPAGDEGLVDDTPFTKTGVARLMEMLNKRAAATEGAGNKVAANMVEFLSPDEDGEDTVSGASVKKLQMLAKRTERLKGRGGAGRKRG